MFNRNIALQGLVRSRKMDLMRISTRFSLPLAALLFAVVLIPSSAWAKTGSVTKNCPTEPAQNVPIASGETYFGTNCVLYTTGDVDSFTFSASAGDTWTLVLGPGASPPTNLCLALYAPGNTTAIFFNCNVVYASSISTNQKLTVTGVYTAVATETSDATITYGLSVERLSPAPPDGIPLTLAKNVTGEVTTPTAQDAFTFYGATSGTYEIGASPTADAQYNLCLSVYQPDGTNVAFVCNVVYAAPISAELTPAESGTYVVVVFVGGDDGTVGYNLEVSCLLGTCPTKAPPPPSCALKDTVTYNATSGILTMNFTVGTPVAATWNGWLVYQNTMQSLWSQAQPITEPPVTVTNTQALAKSGKVGVLSTLTTPTGGITCSSWAQVSTGKP